MRSSRISFLELATLPGWPHGLQLVMDQEQSKGTEIIPVKSIILNSGELGCKYCPGAIFEERAEFRAHYQTPWHIHNQNLVLKSKKALAEEDYDEFVEITAAQSSDSDFWSEEEGEEEDDDEVNEKTLAASPLLKFKCSDHLFEIQRRIIIGDKKSNHDLQMTSELLTNFIQHSLSSTWAIFLVKSGRVFIGIYSVKQGKFTMKKSMKRYTERKKQGGSQMLRDKSGKVAKSAGSQLRRQNEVDLLHDINEVIKEWASELAKCQLIFWNRNFFSQLALFQSPHVLDRSDERLRKFPFSTYKPSEDEALRCITLLSSVNKLA